MNMNELPTHICVNEREVAAKVIDGEAIIINLTKGTYYSLEGVGGAAWSLLASGQSLDETAQALAEHYSVDSATAKKDLHALVSDLFEHELIIASDGGATHGEAIAELPEVQTYIAPTLNAYSDMEDVLALDPPLPEVEVEEEPWTNQA